MSYFGSKLKELMEINRVTGVDIQRQTGIHSSQISRWHSGEQKSVSPEDMTNFCRVVCKTKQQRAELILAHLQDECFGPGADLIEIKIKSAAAKPAAPLSTHEDRLFAFLRRVSIEKPIIKKVLANLAINEGFKHSA